MRTVKRYYRSGPLELRKCCVGVTVMGGITADGNTVGGNMMDDVTSRTSGEKVMRYGISQVALLKVTGSREGCTVYE